MFEVTFKINGRPVNSGNIGDVFERAIFEGVKKNLESRIRQIAGFDANKLRVEAVGSDLSNFKLNISGPEDVVAKVKEGLK